jgi:transcriptional regulator with XRE-family HTH domain
MAMSDKSMKLFGSKLRVARALVGMSLRDVSEKIGVSANAISKYESGQMAPISSVLVKMAKLYGVSLEWLMCPCQITLGWHHGECAEGVKRRAEMCL